MTASAHVAGQVLRWIAVTTSLVAGLVWLATSVETADQGAAAAAAAALRTPGFILPLLPALCGLGAALAAARMQQLGERTALECVGLGPWHTGRAVSAAALALGGLCWLAHGHLIHRAEQVANHLLVPTAADWTWTEQGPLHGDDLLVRLGDNPGLVRVAPGYLDASALDRARQLAMPGTSSAAALATSPSRPARVEVHTRLARVLACGGLALVGWLPLARRADAQLARALLCVVAWVVGDLLLRGGAAHGQLPPAVGAWSATAALWVTLVAAAISQRPSGAARKA